jgi:hypothetical protein
VKSSSSQSERLSRCHVVKYFILFLGICASVYPHVALIVDCSFQPLNRMGANFEEQKLYFSGKHIQYGVRQEYAHMPNYMIVSLKKDWGLLYMCQNHIQVPTMTLPYFKKASPSTEHFLRRSWGMSSCMTQCLDKQTGCC